MEILIYDEISQATAQQTVTLLSENPTDLVVVRINSPGGDVSAALAIYSKLTAHRSTVTIRVEGIAASAASLICCAGLCIAAENALLMIHGPSTGIHGKSGELRETADALDKFAQSMVGIYCRKTHRSVREITSLLDDNKDHWYNALEARSLGLVDSIEGHADPVRIAACLKNLNPPEGFKMTIESAVTADIEARAREQERQRQSEIRAAVSLTLKLMPSQATAVTALQDRLLTTGASVDEARQQLMTALGNASPGPLAAAQGFMDTRSVGVPIAFGGYGAEFVHSAIGDALATRLGARNIKPCAAARDFYGSSLAEIQDTLLQARGINPAGLTRNQRITAALTSSDYPELLGNAAGRTLLSHFEALTQEHREFCDSGDAPDFKPQKAINVSAFPGLELKLEGAETTHGSISESAEGYKLATYARKFSFSREAQINDDLGGFQSTIQAAANAGARLERDLAFGVLTANKVMSDGVALFHATHGNLNDSHSPVNIAGLGIARTLMRKQVDTPGGFVMTVPRFLIVPVAVESDAEALVSSLTYRPDLAGELQTPAWVKALRIIADPRLDATDAGDWYLLSEPVIAPVVRLAFLNGQRGPVVEQDNDFDRDVITYRVRLDVAATAVGYAGAVKMS